MTSLEDLKLWLRIDGLDDDVILQSLLETSKILIKQSTGIKEIDVQGNVEASELYKTVQRIMITELYENRDGTSKPSVVLISLMAQLKVYKDVAN